MKGKMEEHIANDSSSSIGWDLINDLSAISENKDNITEYLLHRLECGLTYTWVGPILLFLNPGKNIAANLYDSSKYKDFFNTSKVLQKDVNPHIFAVAARSHYKLLHGLGQPTQVILISGDSGSGKTFNANQAINFLAAINKNSSALQLERKNVEEFVGKIVSACPLITALSTASTSRNARSSRHGQLIRFEYGNGIISGASIQSFLLERSRVTRGSDNFAIFYQVLYGSPDCELENLGLCRGEKYKLLGKSDYIENDQVRQDFQETLNAMKAICFSEFEKDEILKIIALLIHLGNISFKQTSGDGCSAVDTDIEESRKALKNVGALAALSEEELVELLTTTLISPQSKWRKHSSCRRNLGSTEICHSRLSSIIRHLYDNLFHWLIYRINKTLSDNVEHRSWLGILDIFGFESFSTNGIEELSINYANERIQLYFMQDYLESGQRDLWEEGLSNLQTPNTINLYKDRLGIMENKLFPTLNDVSQCPIQYNLLQLKDRFLVSETSKFLKPSQRDEAFIISHYSRPVEYSLKDLLSKNSDKVPCELATAFTMSSNKFLRSLLEGSYDYASHPENKIYVRKGTTLAKVKQNLDILLRALNKCDTHYVKCVRPRHIEGCWEKNEFKEQLACTGVLDALPLARCKFSIRLSYNEFNKRYFRKSFDIPDNFQQCKVILKDITNETVESLPVYFGKRLIFLEESFFFKLENQRQQYRHQCAKKIQTLWKNYQSRKGLGLITPKNEMCCVSFADGRLELSEDEKSQMNPSDYEHEVLMSTNNKEFSTIEDRDSVADAKDSNAQDLEIKPAKSTGSNVSVEYTFPDDNHSKFYRDLKRCSYFCSKVRHFKTIFVTQWVDSVLAAKHKEGICRDIPGRKGMSEHQKLRILRIKNTLNVEHNLNRNGCTISFGHYTFFYKNRMLSRQRLAVVPVRFHTRLTCLPESHRLPRSELPQGLEDCL